MEKTNIMPYERKYGGETKKLFKSKRKGFDMYRVKEAALLVVLSIFLGRASILNGLAPFGIAFYISLLTKDKTYRHMGIWVLIGIFTANMEVDPIKYGIVLFFSWLVFEKAKGKILSKTLYVALLGSAILFLTGSVYLFFTDFYVYDLFMIGFESIVVFVFIYILSYSIPILIKKSNRKILSNEELICVAISIAIAISGLSNVVVLGHSLENILGILLTLVFAYNGGASVGASVGITIGIITSMSTIGTPIVIGVYGFSGLLAGIFKDLGKIGSGLGMIFGNVILTFYTNGSTEVMIQFEEIIAAFIIFMVLPKNMMKYMEKFVNSSTSETDKVYGDRIQKLVHQRLREYADVFSELAVTYSHIAEKKKLIGQDEIASMVDGVVSKVCNQCGMCRSCWKNNFYGTYNGVVDVIGYLENYGQVPQDKMPETLKKRCIKLDLLLQKIEDMLKIYEIHYEWQKKLFESRKLVGDQFEGVADILDGLDKDMNMDVIFNTDVEDAIYVAFDQEGIPIKNVTVLEKKNGKFEIEIEKRACFDRSQCEEKIAPIVSSVIGRPVTRKNSHCRTNRDDGICSFTLTEAPKYRAMTSVSKISKDQGGVSGDNYSFIDLCDGKYMMALSDGMGSGERAGRESMTTVTLLEQLMEAGFNKDVAIKTINSILLLKSSEEIFSTMDLSIVDLYTGKVEFVKIGAASSFIKRSNGEIEAIKSTSLPIGILDKIDMDSFDKGLNNGDFVIMMSDGVLDADKNVEEKEEWIMDALKNINSRNPKIFAETLLDMAIKKYGNKIEDDMTVLVSKLWETRA